MNINSPSRQPVVVAAPFAIFALYSHAAPLLLLSGSWYPSPLNTLVYACGLYILGTYLGNLVGEISLPFLHNIIIPLLLLRISPTEFIPLSLFYLLEILSLE